MTDLPDRSARPTVRRALWMDPSEVPRNYDGVSPDGELPTLQDYLREYRLTFARKCEGLSPDQLARRSVPPSTMSLLGLARHLAEVERGWRRWVGPEHEEPRLYGPDDGDFEGAVSDQSVVDNAFADLSREQDATDALLTRRSDLGERMGEAGIAVRELWLHRVEEYARHCGHADLLRECIDGRVGL